MRSKAPSRLAAALLAIMLAGCAGGDPMAGLSPGASLGEGPASPLSAPSTPSGPQPMATTMSATAGPIQFLPVVGAPAGVVEALSVALAAEAERAGIAISPSDAPATPRRLKGYLSAIGEGRETVVVFVWDIVDPAGTRTGRIQGQERAGSSGSSAADVWTGVSPETMAAIARRTVAELARSGFAG